jgi:flagellar hook assembly protein FlgD
VEIAYSIPPSSDDAVATLTIYNVLGQSVRTLVESRVSCGTYTAIWDGRDASGREVASGVYLCELRWKTRRQAKQIVLLK